MRNYKLSQYDIIHFCYDFDSFEFKTNMPVNQEHVENKLNENLEPIFLV